MRLPSIDRAIEGARRAAVNFPMVIVSALVTAVAGMVLIDSANDDEWIRVAAAASLGLPLFTGATLFASRRNASNGLAWAFRSVGIAVLLGFFWIWPNWSDETRVIKYFHLSAAFHFLVAIAAYVRVGEPNGFWQFNRELLLRFLTGVVYSIVLFAGLAIALAGVDNLLGVDVGSDTYGRLWVFIAFIFNTWFFAAGVPLDFASLDGDDDYPGGLRAFSQYVLLPLVAVYLLILTSYLVRVLVTREWPSGWIGYLVSALAALGILSLLLVHPLRDREGHGWIDRYARTFWIAIIPSVVMLLMAVWQRIGQYGITERRYLLAILALWLAAVAAYYAVTRSRNIKVIPGSLAALALLSFVGPWSAYSTSLRSQLGRLSGALERHGVLVDGRVSAATDDISEDERREITGALTYVIRYHGTRRIDGWFEEGVTAIDTIGDGTRPSPQYLALQRTTLIMRHLGMEPVGAPTPGLMDYRYYSSVYPRPAFDVAGYDWALTGVTINGFDQAIGEHRLQISFGTEDLELQLRMNGNEVIVHSLTSLVDRMGRNAITPGGSSVPADSMRIDAEGGGIALRLYLTQLTVDATGDPPVVSSAMGDLFLRGIEATAEPDSIDSGSSEN